MGRLLLLLAAAASLNCEVKNSGLANTAGDAGGTGAGGTTELPGDVAAPGPGEKGTGGQGPGGSPYGAEAGLPSGVGGGLAVVDSGRAGGGGGAFGPSSVVTLDAGSTPTGGTAGNGGSTATGGRNGPGEMLDAAAAEVPVIVIDTRPMEKTDVVRDDVSTPDLQDLLPDAPEDRPSPPDIVEVAPPDTVDAAVDAARHLLWHDEFDGAANTHVDPDNWSYTTWGPNAGVNGEKQQYTSDLQNIFIDGDGHLVIRALKTGTLYSSGRINTNGKFSFQTGRLEVRAKLPAGVGSFPGIITMGETGGWPQCGELGLVEQWGQDKRWYYASAYADSASAGNKRNVRYDLVNATTTSEDFHVYSVDLYDDHAVFQFDGDEVMRTSFNASSPFHTVPQYLILDVAVGGNMGGDIDPAGFPMDMVVDYVRVYEL